MAKAIKKTTKKPTKKSNNHVPPVVEQLPAMAAANPNKPVYKMSNRTLSIALIILVVALISYKVVPWFMPALVGNRPVTRLEIASRLEKAYGAQALDDLINEKILDQAIAKSSVEVDETKLTEQLSALETQFEATGGLDEALKQRGLSRKDLEKQIYTQLAVELILSDKISSTDEEVKTQFDSGSTTIYKDKKLDEVADSIKEELKQAKLRDAFLVWFADVKKEAKLKTFGL